MCLVVLCFILNDTRDIFMFVTLVVCVFRRMQSYICTDRWRKTIVKLLKVKMPDLIRLNSAARGEMMHSYIWVLFCSVVSGRYSAETPPT